MPPILTNCLRWASVRGDVSDADRGVEDVVFEGSRA